MTLRLLALFAGTALTLSACTDGKDTGPSGEGDTDTDTDADTDTDTDADTGTAVSGALGTFFLDGSAIDEYSISGTTVACSGCLYAFDGDFTGSVSNFSASVDIADIDYQYAGYDIGIVYANVGGSDNVWGYAYDSGGTTIVYNGIQAYYGYADYIYYGAFYH